MAHTKPGDKVCELLDMPRMIWKLSGIKTTKVGGATFT